MERKNSSATPNWEKLLSLLRPEEWKRTRGKIAEAQPLGCVHFLHSEDAELQHREHPKEEPS